MLTASTSEEGGTKVIDQLYNTILCSVFHSHLLQKEIFQKQQILNTVVCAATPLSISGISGLLDIPEKTVKGHIETLRSVLNIDAAQSVLMFHASFPEFMTDSSRSMKDRHCEVQVHNTTLSLGCFRIMKQSLKFNICKLESSFICDADVKNLQQRINEYIPTHIIYVCCYWVYHLKKSSGDMDELCDKLKEFLLTYLLFWIEVMNLNNAANLCGPMLLEARVWINVCNISHYV
jgi:hypothetical protein